ncbi:MAG: hypothetical protein EOT05_00455 [Candidatus Microsaccharimonas sossegonensis]|uniref:SnoaL-like domain-containing protein n=1 Tax=Candidatus Microsaccharimonas sossegonensis TaxID=2506948 RepID=A0A4V1J7C7_9BACT|nr:MAG: hypothetical protein EOT05_00455 [Candidatus Microsaccharimonas sossegonensis]
MTKKYLPDELMKIVTDSFEAERTNNVSFGKTLITDDFEQRGMFISNGTTFPIFAGGDVPVNLEEAYEVEGREFHIWNIAADKTTQTVFVELAEIEPRGDKKVVWPYVLVCKIENGRIKRSRHYGDPAIIKANVSLEEVRPAVQL